MSTIQTDDITEFIDNLSTSQLEVLFELVSGLDPIEIVEVEGKKAARFSTDEMDLIGTFVAVKKSGHVDSTEDSTMIEPTA